MKKIFSTLFILGCLFSLNAQAERDLRLNFSADFHVGLDSTDAGGDEKDKFITGVSTFSAEIFKIREDNWLFGGVVSYVNVADTQFVQISYSSGSGTYKKNLTYNLKGSAFEFGPCVGKVYGEKQNFHLIFYPVLFEFIDYETYSVSDDSGLIDASTTTDDSYTKLKSGVKLNWQWGKNLWRNGIYIGANLSWASFGDFSNTIGCEFCAGFKTSFAF